MKKLTHIDARGEASMVDVSSKPITRREAVARGEIRLAKATLSLIDSRTIAKGNVLATARVAGIIAAKKTGELIPLCHPLAITHCEVNFEIPRSRDRWFTPSRLLTVIRPPCPARTLLDDGFVR